MAAASSRDQKVIRVYADVREESSGVPRELAARGVIVIRRQLPEGDYIIPPDIIIERKSAHDFVSSLFDGRLFDQAQRLKANYKEVYYIIEGNLIREFRYWHDREPQLIGAMTTLVSSYDVKVLWSGGPAQTAEYIASLALKSFKEGLINRPVVINKKPSYKDIREWQLYIVQSFPGIGAKTAERILERFGSLEAFFNASVAEIASVEGVGEAKAARIKELLKAPYKRVSRQTTLESFYSDKDNSQRSA